MAGGNLRKYVQPLPVPGAGIVVATPTASNEYSFTQRPLDVQLHPDLPATPVWAYDDGSGLAGQAGSFGMAVVAQSGEPLRMSFTHQLPAQYPNWIPVDTRLTPRHDAEVRLMTHLHGGFVEAASDGNPAITPLGFGPGQSQTVVSIRTRRRRMPASLLWFHDHGLGTTRLNVFAGLAAAYILRDEYDTGAEPNPIGIPGGAYEIPLVIQDRQFNRDGTFRYPISEVPEATWIGEYFGDVMLVNGKVWPFLELEPRMYRFRILNGCNARILDLSIGGQKLWQIGAEGGMWDRPVPVQRLVLAPAERADVLVDFRKLAGARLVVKNHNPTKPVSTPAPSLEQVMQIRANSSALPLTCSLKRFEHRSSNVPSRTTSGKSQKGSADNPTIARQSFCCGGRRQALDAARQFDVARALRSRSREGNPPRAGSAVGHSLPRQRDYRHLLRRILSWRAESLHVPLCAPREERRYLPLHMVAGRGFDQSLTTAHS